MYAIIRLGNGKYYTSVVFGYYCNITAKDEYQRYLESIHNRYYLVLNKDKSALVKQYIYDKKSKYLEPTVLIVDGNQEGWAMDDKGCGYVGFLAKESQNKIDELSHVLLSKCIQIDQNYKYEEYPEIKTTVDIDNLMWVSGYFHDACIDELKDTADGELYVRFDGVWGCNIEIWFKGDVTYSLESRNPDKYDPYWGGSTVVIKDGYIYFVDEYNMNVEDITDCYCWFKAKQMRYHVIPNN